VRAFRAILSLALLVATSVCRKEAEAPPPAPAEAVKWEVTAVADKKGAQVAEPLTVSVTVRHPPGAGFFLATGASLLPFELIERVDEPAGPATSPTETRITLRVAAYRLPGDVAIPPLKVEYRDASDPSKKMASIATAPLPIKLVTSLTPEVTDIHDLKGPIEDIPVPSRWDRLWWLLLALVAAVIAYLVYRRLRKKKEEIALSAPPVPLAPAEVEAEQALRALANARLLEQGRVKEFYVQLAEIVKRYAGRRFEVPYLERTTSEIVDDLRRMAVRREWMEALRSLLEPSDLVKFARFTPEAEDSQRMLPQAFRYVDETRPAPPPAAPVLASALEAGT